MSNIAILNSVQTMSSLDIADLTGKKHGHVKRDIENTLQEAGIDASKFGCIYKDAKNREQTYYELPRRECDLVVSGYSVPYRLAIIDRWYELESKNGLQLPETYSDALRALADKSEKLQLVESERDHAKATKAQIDSKRSATACGRLGAQVKKNKKLENENSILKTKVGIHTDWKQAKAIDWLEGIFVLDKVAYQQIGKKLSAISVELDIAPIEVEDSQFGKIKAYHKHVINELKLRLKSDSDLLVKYRKEKAS